jgi:O-antigen/teichoic acid export membrane protein
MIVITPAARLRQLLGPVVAFFLGEGALQAINISAGLLLVRFLPLEGYAQYGLAFGFQATASILMDMGYAGTIIPLVGNRIDDRALVGRYVRAAKYLRDRAFLLLAPFTSAAFLAITAKQHWSWSVQIALLTSVLLCLWSAGQASCYSAPFFLYGRLREFYLPQTLSAAAKLILYVVLRVAGGLNAVVAAGLNAVNAIFVAGVLGKQGRRYIEWPDRDDRSAIREVLKYVLPAIPIFVFFAFQSQIALFLISIFGQTVNIAQVAALGRLGQLFGALTTFNMVIVEPRIARLGSERLLATYLRLVVLAAACCAPVVFFAFIVPGPFLWLLGPQYRDLGNVVGVVILTASINYLANLVWIMNRARRWLFWRGTVLEIVLTLAVEIAFIGYFGVRTTRDAILLSLAVSLCSLSTHAYIGVHGFLGGSRSLTYPLA